MTKSYFTQPRIATYFKNAVIISFADTRELKKLNPICGFSDEDSAVTASLKIDGFFTLFDDQKSLKNGLNS